MKPHSKKQWVIPPKKNAEFVAFMEDILDLYRLPYNPKFPVVCMDEQLRQLVSETRKPIPAEPGRPERFDYEYERNGTANIFMFFEPLAGKRFVSVAKRRTAVDRALAVEELLDVHYPDAEKVRLACDNLNTHCAASLYKAFPPEVARRLAKRLEIHYTPKHGSWLDIAEIELSALTRQCLDRRVPDVETLREEVAFWETDRNERRKGVDWRFKTGDARIKLKRLYPQIQM